MIGSVAGRHLYFILMVLLNAVSGFQIGSASDKSICDLML